MVFDEQRSSQPGKILPVMTKTVVYHISQKDSTGKLADDGDQA